MKNFLLSLALVLLASCASQEKHDFKSPVDINPLISQYRDFSNNVTTNPDIFECEELNLVYDSIAAPHEVTFGRCALSQWWLEPDEYSSDIANEVASAYNPVALINTVSSDIELWTRGLVSADSIVDGIKAMDLSVIKDKNFRKEAEIYRKGLITGILDAESGKEETSSDVSTRYFQYLNKNVLNKLGDTVRIYRYYDAVDSLITKYVPVVEELKDSDGVSPEALLYRVSISKSFDEQCGIALAACLHSYSYSVWVRKLLSVLLNSGQYSYLLERMWILWRAHSQNEICGMSRDAVIPNYNYDKLRKKVFSNIVSYIDSNPADDNAISAALMIANDPHLIRNGSFMFGNDAAMHIMTYCPDFHD